MNEHNNQVWNVLSANLSLLINLQISMKTLNFISTIHLCFTMSTFYCSLTWFLTWIFSYLAVFLFSWLILFFCPFCLVIWRLFLSAKFQLFARKSMGPLQGKKWEQLPCPMLVPTGTCRPTHTGDTPGKASTKVEKFANFTY